MDLSDVHERAFPEIFAAFRAQVKREDISDRAKIDTLRLKLLSIVLTAADWVSPVQVQLATADIVHFASGRSEYTPTGVVPDPYLRILETGYNLLVGMGGEEPGYGLYSYGLVVNDSGRSTKFLRDVFSAIPSVKDTAAQHSQTNIFYIPIKYVDERIELMLRTNVIDVSEFYAKNFYDYKTSRALLDHLCDPPAEEIRAVCEGDLSKGPYIFTYAKPASNVAPVPPPFLFMDLSDVHERAFPEIIAAFKAQVKRKDISDGAKINTLRLTLLNITLKAADWLVPVQKAMADIVHAAAGQTEGKHTK
jgi:hypothetical protein